MAANNDSHSTPSSSTPQQTVSRSAAGKPGKGQAVMKLVLVFFISLFSFAVGTYVGKTYSDQRHKTAKLEPKNHLAIADKGHHQDDHESAGHEESSAHDQPKENAHSESSHGTREIASAKGSQEVMTDEEIARLAEEYVTDDEAPGTKGGHDKEDGSHHHSEKAVSKANTHGGHGEESHGSAKNGSAAKDEHEAHPVAKKSTPVAKNPILPEDADSKYERNPAASPAKKKIEAMHESVEKNAKPAESSSKGRKPSSLPTNPIQDSLGKYTVQIASFATEDEAKERAAQLRNQGYNSFYVQALVKGNVWYRVSIGLFNTERDAKNYMVDYRKGNSAIQAIVQKISAE